jgi:hypothetical protein
MQLKRPSAATAIAFVALVIVVGSGSAVGASLITGRQIKNGSITGTDVKNKSLSPIDFRGSVKGEPGERGPIGPQGNPGPQGPPGPVNVTTLTRVTSPEQNVPAGQVGSTQVFCPSGMKVVSGGGSFITGNANGISASQANEAQTGWFIVGGNTSSVDGSVQAIAFCAESGKAIQPGAAARARADGRAQEAAVRAKVAAALAK